MASTEANYPTLEKDKVLKPSENGIRSPNDEGIEGEGDGEISEKQPCLDPKKYEGNNVAKSDDDTDKSVNLTVESKSKKHHYEPNKIKSSSNNDSKRFNFRFDYSVGKVQNYVQNKTGMNTRWSVAFAAVLLLLLFFLVLSIVMTTLYWRSQSVFPVCKTTACLRASAEILPKMNFSVSPCDDMKNFACGSWLSTKPRPLSKSVWNSKRILQYKTRVALRDRIVTLSNLISNTVPWKIKLFYESCMNVENIESEEHRPLTKIISHLEGWKVLDDMEIKTWDFKETMKRLHSEYRVSPYFEISLTPDPEFPSKPIIQVLPSGLGLPGKVYYEQSDSPVVSAYKQFMRDVTKQLGATSLRARSFSEEMFGYERRIAQVTPDIILPLNISLYNNRLTLKQLMREIATMVPLQDVLIAKFPNGHIDDETQLLVPHVEYLKDISSIISSTDKVTQNNYLLWKLASEYMQYLSEPDRALVAIYKKEVTGEEEDPERWETCIEMTQKFLGFGLSVLLENSTEDKEVKTKIVNETFTNIRDTVKNSVEERKWDGKELKQHVSEKLSSLSLQVGYPRSMTGSDYLKEHYSKLYIVKNDFFQNVLYGMVFLKEEEQTRLTSTAEEYRWIDIMSASIPAVGYSISANKVIVPHSLLVEPSFDAHFMPPILYGSSFGIELSSAILSAITPAGIVYSSDGTILSSEFPAVTQSYDYVSKAQTCLSNSFTSKDILIRPVMETPYQYSTLLAISALEQAFKAMKEEVSKTTRMYQPAMESYDSDALFFIKYAQSICTVKTQRQQSLDRTLDASLEDSQLLEVTLRQVKDFSWTFSCDSESKYCAQDVCKSLL